jgi:hypothetical protein
MGDAIHVFYFVRLKFNDTGLVDYLHIITYSPTLLYVLKILNFFSFQIDSYTSPIQLSKYAAPVRKQIIRSV